MKVSAWFRPLSQFGAVRILAAAALIYFFISVRTGSFPIPVMAAEPGSAGGLVLEWSSAIGIICSVFFLLGSFARISALGCLVCLNTTLVALPVIAELHYPLLSLLLGTYAIFGTQAWREWRPRGLWDELRDRELWHLPLLYTIFLGFTFMGGYKLLFPLWWNGEVVRVLCPRGPLGTMFPFVCNFLPNRWIGFLVLFAEVTSLPLALHPRTRPVAWLLNVILQLGISQFIFLRRITYVILVMLLFLFDARWLQQSVRPKSSVKLSSR